MSKEQRARSAGPAGANAEGEAGDDAKDILQRRVDEARESIAAQASAAWEAAVCWDDEHAVKRLAEVRAV